MTRNTSLMTKDDAISGMQNLDMCRATEQTHCTTKMGNITGNMVPQQPTPGHQKKAKTKYKANGIPHPTTPPPLRDLE